VYLTFFSIPLKASSKLILTSYLKSFPLLPDRSRADPLDESPVKSPKKSSNISENEEESAGVGKNQVMKILSDFEKYKDIFELGMVDARFKKNQYFKTKYSELLSSEFFKKYMPAEFCLNYEIKCFAKLGFNFNSILSKHQLEMTLPFKVTYQQKTNVVEKSFFSNIPLNIAFAFTATYLFFIFTNKYFKRKIK